VSQDQVESSSRDAVLCELLPLEEPGSHAALLTLNNPDALNPLDSATFHRLNERLDECDADDSVRVILIIGAGRAFSAGGDLKKYIEMRKDPAGWSMFLEDSHRVFQKMRLHRKPIVSLVNGTAVAGGLEMIVCSDFAYASATARIGDAHVRFGQMGGGGSLSLVPRVMGAPQARELIFSGRLLDAETACAMGIVNKVVPAEDLVEAGRAFANEVARWSPLAISNAKFVINESLESGLGVAAQMRFELERTAYFTLTSEDSAEGLIAFSEKRPPKWTGR
jgi:enoyl-CoA hydratase/carnithine racemase